ncbi:2,5-diketo-D-gluconate reductase A [Sphingomonas naasensis]|uniref:Aldo/keto reductase n=1 Tax=Sphingomonas naasensis TaxID=1344951 RepID=A0A4S1WI87_9SPHN|nr:aldo/keto reductase [Sphingomonas naasensis]NIJ21682.1 2,5-diketo-D-gluconate reductase A [Sphingomonas naasensis]TGX41390.1 aldo/keto reductase [Sphingomonas naasensis]
MTRTLTMNDGRTIPAIGFGTYLVPDDDAARITREGLAVGYTLVDTAAFYGNERGVAEGLDGREDIFVTTKLWRSDMGHDAALRAFDRSLAQLARDSVDLYLIHWPMPSLGKHVEIWQALVRLRDEGRAKSIGVSNFGADHLRDILDATGVAPALNQVELHPGFQQRALRAFHAEHGILTQSWAPLGQGKMLAHPVIVRIAEARGCTPAQAILAWHLHHGLAVIPKASARERLAANLAAGAVALEAADIAAIDALDDPAGRLGPDPSRL